MSDETPSLHLLQQELQPVVDWYLFGVYLKVEKHELDKIYHDHFLMGKTERCKTELLDFWLKNRTQEFGVWEEVIDALEKMKKDNLVRKLRSKYLRLEMEIETVNNNTVQHDEAMEICESPEPILVKESVVEAFTNLERTFARLVADVKQALERNNVSLTLLHRFIIERLEIEKPFSEPENIDQLFQNIRNSYCCLKFHLLSDIINEFLYNMPDLPDVQPIQPRMKKYAKDFAEFTRSACMKDLIRCIRKAVQDQNAQELELKLSGFWHQLTLEHFEKLVQMLFRGRSNALNNLQVTQGCLRVSWFVHESIIPSLVSLVENKLHLMQSLGIMKIAVGDSIVIDQGEDIEDISSAVYLAISQNQLEAVKFLLSVGADPNASVGDKHLFFEAIQGGNVEIVETFIGAGADIHHKKIDGSTSLSTACFKGYVEIVELLLAHGADPNQQDNRNRTPLMVANSNQNLEVMKILLKTKASQSSMDAEGFAFLISACKEGDIEAVKTLIEVGIPLDFQESDMAWPALMFAADEGHLEVVKLLVAGGANVDLKTSTGDTALIRAILSNSSLVVQFLLESKADPNLQGESGRSPLHVACAIQNVELVQLLLENKANPNIQDTSEATPLLVSFTGLPYKTLDPAIPTLLLAYGANPNTPDVSGYTPLMAACVRDKSMLQSPLVFAGLMSNVEAIQVLLAPNITNAQSLTEMLLHILASGRRPMSELRNMYDVSLSEVEGIGVVTGVIKLMLADFILELSVLMVDSDPQLNTEDILEIIKLVISSGANLDLCTSSGDTALIQAIQSNNLPVAHLLIKSKADLDIQDKYGRTALREACSLQNAELVETLLKNDANPNVQDSNKNTPLIIACLNQSSYPFDPAIPPLLLAYGADPNTRQIFGRTALMAACSSCSEVEVDALLRAGADVKIEDYEGLTALSFATNKLNVKIANLLVTYGADPNQQDENKITLLMRASFNGKIDAVKLLLSIKADPNLTELDGLTALTLACQNNDSDVATVLVEGGASLDIQDNNGMTALMSAADEGNLKIVKLLVEAGANVNVQDNKGFTALIVAILQEQYRVAHYLIESNANLNIAVKSGKTALHAACSVRNAELVDVLLSNGADPNICDSNNYTPLFTACIGLSDQPFNPVIPPLLLAYGADPNKQDIIGQTALMGATRYNYEEGVEALLDAGADVEIGSVYCTALSIASFLGHVNIMNMLLAHGADPNQYNDFIVSPLVLACARKNINVIKILLASKADPNRVNEDGLTLLSMIISPAGKEFISKVGSLFEKDSFPLTELQNAENDLEIIKLLTAAGADFDLCTSSGDTPLIQAIQSNNLPVAHFLIKSKADLNIQGQYEGTALHEACSLQNAELVEMLLKNGADPNIQDFDKNTPLITSCLNQSDHPFDPTIPPLLLAYGADPNKQDILGRTALIAAIRHNYEEGVEALLDAGADIHEDSVYCTGLSIASFFGHVNIVNLLLAHGADPNRYNNFIVSPLVLACLRRNIDVIKVLLASKADPNSVDEDGETVMLKIISTTGKEFISRIGSLFKEAGVPLIELEDAVNITEIIELLTAAGADLDLCTSSGDTVLIQAIESNNLPVAHLLIKSKADLNIQGKYRRTALREACLLQNAELVETLLKNGANPNIQDSNKNTPLIISCLNPGNQPFNPTIPPLLLAYGADPNARQIFGRTALMAACLYCSEADVEALLRAGADANIEDDEENTALSFTIYKLNVKIANLLVAYGADPNQQDKNKSTLIMRASFSGKIDTVKLLLSIKADPNLTEVDGLTALMLACQNNDINVATVLVEAGASLDIQDNNGTTALMSAADEGNLNIVKLLVKAGANVNVQDNDGFTALITATLQEQFPVVHYLIESNADLNIGVASGKTALHAACSVRNAELVDMLLSNGADPNICDSNNYTPLIIACVGLSDLPCNPAIPPLLLAYGADPNKPDNEGCTALMVATLYGFEEGVEALLDGRADVNIEDEQGRVALYAAAQTGNTTILSLLLENTDDNYLYPAVKIADSNKNQEAIKLLLNVSVSRGLCTIQEIQVERPQSLISTSHFEQAIASAISYERPNISVNTQYRSRARPISPSQFHDAIERPQPPTGADKYNVEQYSEDDINNWKVNHNP